MKAQKSKIAPRYDSTAEHENKAKRIVSYAA